MPRSPDTVTLMAWPEDAFETSEIELEFKETHPPRNPRLAIKRDSVRQSCAKRVHGLKVHLADHATAIDRFFSGFSPVMSRYLFPETQLS